MFIKPTDGRIVIDVLSEDDLVGKLKHRIADLEATIVQLNHGLDYQVECVSVLQEKESQYLARIAELEKKAQSYDDLLSVVYGQNLMVHGWHLNGEPEPLDNFIDNNRHE